MWVRVTLCLLGNLACCFVVCWIFSKSTFSKNCFRVKQFGSKSDLTFVYEANLHAVLSSADFYSKNNFFEKLFKKKICKCLTAWIQIGPTLIWVQTVCKGYMYQKTTLVGKELIIISLCLSIMTPCLNTSCVFLVFLYWTSLITSCMIDTIFKVIWKFLIIYLLHPMQFCMLLSPADIALKKTLSECHQSV